MLQTFTLITILALTSANPISTPLLGKVLPQPIAPASTEHADYVGVYTPILRSTAYVASAPIIPTAVGHFPLAYAANYLTYHPSVVAAAAAPAVLI